MSEIESVREICKICLYPQIKKGQSMCGLCIKNWNIFKPGEEPIVTDVMEWAARRGRAEQKEQLNKLRQHLREAGIDRHSIEFMRNQRTRRPHG